MIDSRQRVIAAMNFMTPTRVALVCQFSISFMMNRLKSDPVMFWYDMKTFRKAGLILGLEVHGEYGTGASLRPVLEKVASDLVMIKN